MKQVFITKRKEKKILFYLKTAQTYRFVQTSALGITIMPSLLISNGYLFNE